jgi:hypothetical protein
MHLIATSLSVSKWYNIEDKTEEGRLGNQLIRCILCIFLIKLYIAEQVCTWLIYHWWGFCTKVIPKRKYTLFLFSFYKYRVVSVNTFHSLECEHAIIITSYLMLWVSHTEEAWSKYQDKKYGFSNFSSHGHGVNYRPQSHHKTSVT